MQATPETLGEGAYMLVRCDPKLQAMPWCMDSGRQLRALSCCTAQHSAGCEQNMPAKALLGI